MITDVPVSLPLPVSGETTLTYVQEPGQVAFRGIVDATNLNIFRDFLAMFPGDGDVIVCVADLEIRIPEAASLLVETGRRLGAGRRLVLTTAPADPAGLETRLPYRRERTRSS